MLESTPAVKLLVTSREVPDLRGEWVFDDARDQRLALFLNFAEEAERKLREAEQLTWPGRLEQGRSGVITYKRSRGSFGSALPGERAARLLGAAEAVRETAVWPADRIEHDRSHVQLHAWLDEATFAAAWATGRSASRDQAIAEALE